MSKVIQIIFGFGNRTVAIPNDGSTITTSKLFAKIRTLFSAEDENINSLLPGGVDKAKCGETAKFESEKILSSLVKIGMPIETAIRTLENAITDIQSHANEHSSLSTKDIRRIVADGIRNIEADDKFQTEEWSYRYIRRYGHDSRRVVIYNAPLNQEYALSYSCVAEVIENAFRRIVPESAIKEISRAQMDRMAEYILEFVNGCDLYYIDYNILMAMIIELSRQPPHPWLITEKTKEKIIEYDISAIQSNLRQISANESDSNLLYCYSEIIHHASALILEGYQWFLGQDDFSAFYILSNLISEYSKSTVLDIATANHPLQRLERDLAIIGESIGTLSQCLSCVEKFLKQNRKVSEVNTKAMIKYGEIAILLAKKDEYEKVDAFIDSDWSLKSSEEILKNAYNIFRTLTKASGRRTPTIGNGMFRFKYIDLDLDGCVLKHQYIVLYIDQKFDFATLNELNGRIHKDQANVVLILSENENKTNANATIVKQHLNGDYWCIPFTREMLRNLIYIENQADYFVNVLLDAIQS